MVSLSLSDTFGKMAQMLERGQIRDFSLTRTTMTEVFTDFAKFQINAASKEIDFDGGSSNKLPDATNEAAVVYHQRNNQMQ